MGKTRRYNGERTKNYKQDAYDRKHHKQTLKIRSQKVKRGNEFVSHEVDEMLEICDSFDSFMTDGSVSVNDLLDTDPPYDK